MALVVLYFFVKHFQVLGNPIRKKIPVERVFDALRHDHCNVPKGTLGNPLDPDDLLALGHLRRVRGFL